MKATLSSTWNSPNQQRGWVGPGRVPSYDLFEFALMHVAAKSKGPPEIGCSFHNCGGSWKCFCSSLFSWNSKGWELKWGKKKTHQKKACKTPGSSAVPWQTAQPSPDTKWGSVHCLLPLWYWPGPFFFSSSLASLLIAFYQEFGVSIGPKSKSFTLLLFLCYCAEACQCHALFFFENWVL